MQNPDDDAADDSLPLEDSLPPDAGEEDDEGTEQAAQETEDGHECVDVGSSADGGERDEDYIGPSSDPSDEPLAKKRRTRSMPAAGKPQRQRIVRKNPAAATSQPPTSQSVSSTAIVQVESPIAQSSAIVPRLASPRHVADRISSFYFSAPRGRRPRAAPRPRAQLTRRRRNSSSSKRRRRRRSKRARGRAHGIQPLRHCIASLTQRGWKRGRNGA